MEKILSQIKVELMNSIAIKNHMDNTSSRIVYPKERATREHILNKFVPDLIKSDIWFHILKLVSQINFPHQQTLARSKEYSEKMLEGRFIYAI